MTPNQAPFRHLRLASNGSVAQITLEKPPVNVLDGPFIEEIQTALIQTQDWGAKVVVVSSAYEHVFSAGVSVEDHFPGSLDAMLERFHRLCRQVFECNAVTVTLVRGSCYGGAMEFVSCFDFVVSEPTAQFGQPEISLGCFAPWAAAWYPQLLGVKVAKRLLLLGEPIAAEEARRLGLVDRIAPEGCGDDAAQRLAAEILDKSRPALTACKKSLRLASHPIRSLVAIEDIYRNELATSEDMAEGLTAFVEKRRPKWKDR